jgi:hypothetical protein
MVGKDERWAIISSALRGFDVLRNFLGISVSPSVSKVNKSADSFSAIIPLQTVLARTSSD